MSRTDSFEESPKDLSGVDHIETLKEHPTEDSKNGQQTLDEDLGRAEHDIGQRAPNVGLRAVWRDVVQYRNAYFMAVSASMGGMLFGWDTGLIGGILTETSFKRSFNLENKSASALSDLSGNIVSVLQAGCFFGALFSAPVADRLGRKLGLLISSAIFLIGSIIQTTSGLGTSDLSQVYVGRVIGGFGVGMVSAVVPIYISESAPTPIRGRCTGTMQLLNVTGIMLSYWVNYGLNKNIHPVTSSSIWRIAFALQCLPGLVLFLLIALFQSESPRWLCEKGRFDEARKVLAKMRGLKIEDAEVEWQLNEIKQDFEGRERIGIWQQGKEVFSSRSMFYRGFIGVIVMFCQQWTGTNSVNYYSPQIFSKLGLSSTDSGLFATGIYGVVKVVFTSLALGLAVEQSGRKISLIIGGMIQGISMFILGIYSEVHPSGPPIPASYAAIVFVYVYVIGYSLSWGTVPWMVATEVVPNRLRGFTMSFALMTQWLFNFVIARITPNMLDSIGGGTFLLFGACCLAMTVWVVVGLPETKGVPLEEVHLLFEGSVIRRSLEDMPGVRLCGMRKHR